MDIKTYNRNLAAILLRLLEQAFRKSNSLHSPEVFACNDTSSTRYVAVAVGQPKE